MLCHVLVSSAQAPTQSRCSANAYYACAEHVTSSYPSHSPPFPTPLCPRAWPLRMESQRSLAPWLLAGFSQRKQRQEVRGRRRTRWGYSSLASPLDHRLAAAAFLCQKPQLPSCPLSCSSAGPCSLRPSPYPAVSPGSHHALLVLLSLSTTSETQWCPAGTSLHHPV